MAVLWWLGQDNLALNASDLRHYRRGKIWMVFQHFALLPQKPVLENVMYGLRVDNTKKPEASRRASEQIAIVGLQGFETRFPGQPSGGMQQRVGLARAVTSDADILQMDEAFSALDPLLRHDMQMQLKKIQGRLHKTIDFITHDLDKPILLGDRIAILQDGAVRQIGPEYGILTHPADDDVERFVRDVNRARIITCGSLADPSISGMGDVAAEDAVEDAFGTLAMSGGAVNVRQADGCLAAGLT